MHGLLLLTVLLSISRFGLCSLESRKREIEAALKSLILKGTATRTLKFPLRSIYSSEQNLIYSIDTICRIHAFLGAMHCESPECQTAVFMQEYTRNLGIFFPGAVAKLEREESDGIHDAYKILLFFVDGRAVFGYWSEEFSDIMQFGDPVFVCLPPDNLQRKVNVSLLREFYFHPYTIGIESLVEAKQVFLDPNIIPQPPMFIPTVDTRPRRQIRVQMPKLATYSPGSASEEELQGYTYQVCFKALLLAIAHNLCQDAFTTPISKKKFEKKLKHIFGETTVISFHLLFFKRAYAHQSLAAYTYFSGSRVAVYTHLVEEKGLCCPQQSTIIRSDVARLVLATAAPKAIITEKDFLQVCIPMTYGSERGLKKASANLNSSDWWINVEMPLGAVTLQERIVLVSKAIMDKPLGIDWGNTELPEPKQLIPAAYLKYILPSGNGVPE